MHKTIAETRAYMDKLLWRLPLGKGVDVGLCVPFTALAAAVEAAGGSGVKVLAQNMHQEPEGAFTGEISAPMLTELGVHGVVLGHSERRRYDNETDRALQEKVPAALDAGLEPILCVGETEDEHEAGETQRKLRHQVQEALEQVAEERRDVVIATSRSGRSAPARWPRPSRPRRRSPSSARSWATARRRRPSGCGCSDGGTVKPTTPASFSQPDVDGALVGGASLDPDEFAEIVAAAVR